MDALILSLYVAVCAISAKRLRSIRNWLSPLVVFPLLYFVLYFLPYLLQEHIQFTAIQSADLSDEVVRRTMVFLLVWVALFVVGVLLREVSVNPHRVAEKYAVSSRAIKKYTMLVLAMNCVGVVLICWAETRFQSLGSGFRAYKVELSRSGYQMSSLDRGIGMLGMMMTLLSTLGAGVLQGMLPAATKRLSFYLHLSVFPNVLYLFISLSRGFTLPYGLMYVVVVLTKRRVSFRDVTYLLMAAFLVFAGVGLVSQLRALQDGGGFQSAGKVLDTGVDVGKTMEAVNGLQTMVWAFDLEGNKFLDGLLSLLAHINPLPSCLAMPTGVVILAEEMGITSVGIPMPAIGEVYFRLGFFGAVLAFPFGLLAGHLWAGATQSRDRGLYVLVYVALLHCVIVGMHSNLRAATRPFLWCISAIVFIKLIQPSVNKVLSQPKWIS